LCVQLSTAPRHRAATPPRGCIGCARRGAACCRYANCPHCPTLPPRTCLYYAAHCCLLRALFTPARPRYHTLIRAQQRIPSPGVHCLPASYLSPFWYARAGEGRALDKRTIPVNCRHYQHHLTLPTPASLHATTESHASTVAHRRLLSPASTTQDGRQDGRTARLPAIISLAGVPPWRVGQGTLRTVPTIYTLPRRAFLPPHTPAP